MREFQHKCYAQPNIFYANSLFSVCVVYHVCCPHFLIGSWHVEKKSHSRLGCFLLQKLMVWFVIHSVLLHLVLSIAFLKHFCITLWFLLEIYFNNLFPSGFFGQILETTSKTLQWCSNSFLNKYNLVESCWQKWPLFDFQLRIENALRKPP